ncbi:MAG: methyltransferase domain-containing protein [Burkholderiales bacterium]
MTVAMSRRALLHALVALPAAALFPSLARAQDFPRYGDDLYQPRLRQPGKDVMWLPTPDAMVTRMLQAAGVTTKDVVYDLGAGEGRIPIAAAKQFGARAVGIEYDKDLAALATRNAQRAGVADKVTIIAGDIFKEDFTQATVVTMYLLPDLNYQLRPQLLAMKPGTRIVSHMWDMGEWEPDEAMTIGESQAFLWRVPAQVAGRWTLADENRFFRLDVDLVQKFQRIGGNYTLRGATRPLLGAYINGTTLGFTFVDFDDSVRSVRVEVAGDRLRGQLRFAGNDTPVSGMRTPVTR